MPSRFVAVQQREMPERNARRARFLVYNGYTLATIVENRRFL